MAVNVICTCMHDECGHRHGTGIVHGSAIPDLHFLQTTAGPLSGTFFFTLMEMNPRYESAYYNGEHKVVQLDKSCII